MPWLLGAERVDRDAELRAVGLERLDLHAAELVLDPRGDRRAVGRARCGRRWRPCGRAGAPDGRRAAGRRTPAGSSPRGRGAGRCRGGRRPPRGRPRSCRTAWSGSGMVQLRRRPALTTARTAAGRGPGFSKWWGRSASKVTVSPVAQLVALAVDVQDDGAFLDDRDLAAAGLVHRRVAGAAGLRAGVQHVAAELGALARQRRREHLERCGRCARSRRRGARRRGRCDTEPPSSRRSSCERRRSSPSAIRAATASVGLVSPRSTWLSIGALTPERSARSRSDRPPASRSAFTRGPMVMAALVSVDVVTVTRTLSRTRVSTLATPARTCPREWAWAGTCVRLLRDGRCSGARCAEPDREPRKAAHVQAHAHWARTAVPGPASGLAAGDGSGPGTSGLGRGASPRAAFATASVSARR